MQEVKNKGPVAAGFEVYQSFYSYHGKLKLNKDLVYSESFIKDYKAANGGVDKKVGGHAVIIVGYQKRGNLFNYIVQNSWGTDGTAHAGYFLYEACKDIYRFESWGVTGVNIKKNGESVVEDIFVDATVKKSHSATLKLKLDKNYGLPGETNH